MPERSKAAQGASGKIRIDKVLQIDSADLVHGVCV